jgi:hypothetical protein
MSAGDARHGRRDNGLVAAEYAAAGDVDPRVGEHLLDVLALDGIAAYLRPSTDLHPVTRSTVLPSRPTDRLFVDRAHVATARDYVTRLAGEAEQAEQAERAERADRAEPADTLQAEADDPPGTGLDVDAAWAQIVAGYDATAEPTGRTAWPEPPPRAEPEPPRYRPARPAPPVADEPSLLDGLDSFGADLPDDDDDERFTPPVAPPVPRPSMPTTLAVIGIVGGLAMFLKPDLVSFLSESLAMFLGFTAIVSGFGTLVWRLRPGDEDDTDPDNGAKV